MSVTRSWSSLDKRVWQMAFARCVNTMGLSLVMSFLGIYVVKTRGYPAWVYGAICVVANLCQSWSNAWAGSLSDRIGRRPLITNGLLVRAVVIALLGTQVFLHAPLWSIALNMVASSTLRGCFEPVAYALVSDVVTDEQRIRAFGLQRMGTNLGWAVGPALGGLLTLFLPYGTIFYIAAAGMIAAALVTMRVEDPVRRRADSEDDLQLTRTLKTSFGNPVLRLLLLGTFLCALLETQMFSTFSIYFTREIHFTEADVGWLYMINGVVVLVLQMPALALIQRLGIARTLPWASLFQALGFGIIGLATGFPGAALAMVTLTTAEVMFDPSHQTAIAEVADPAQRGRTYGVVGFSTMVGVACAPLIGGILLDTVGTHHAVMWALIACFGLGQAWCFALFVRRRTAPTVRPLELRPIERSRRDSAA